MALKLNALTSVSFFFFCLVRLGFELRALCFQNMCSITWGTSCSFSSGYFGDGVSRTIWAGLELCTVLPISAFQVTTQGLLTAGREEVCCQFPALRFAVFGLLHQPALLSWSASALIPLNKATVTAWILISESKPVELECGIAWGR
jgi:hypothetical protein